MELKNKMYAIKLFDDSIIKRSRIKLVFSIKAENVACKSRNFQNYYAWNIVRTQSVHFRAAGGLFIYFPRFRPRASG